MSLVIRPYKKADYEQTLAVCIAAFEPIYESFEATLGPRICLVIRPYRKADYERVLAVCIAA